MSTPKNSTTQPQLCVISEAFMKLSPADCEALYQMEEIGLTLERDAPFSSPQELKNQWAEITTAIEERYCPVARETHSKFGSWEAYEKHAHVSETGRHNAWHSLHSPDFPKVMHPIAARIRDRAEKARVDYAAETATLREPFGLGAVAKDEVTNMLDTLIALCLEVEALHPKTYRPGWSGHFKEWIRAVE
jgi:hypothetical protein